MKHSRKLVLLALILFKLQTIIAQTPIKQQKLTNEELKTWWQKDLVADTIPGISLDKAYAELLQGKNGQSVIVAVLDTGVDYEHEDLKDHIWTNSNEIPDNGIDDDQNGYIDDVHGWNFLGNSKGENLLYARVTVARTVAYHEKK